MASSADILIIGGGFAGLTAATTLVRQYHTAIVFDAGKYRNDKTYHMHTLPTWDHKHPEEFRAKARQDLERYNTVKFENTEIRTVRKTEDGLFEAMGKDGRTWTGSKLILASGVEDIYPDIGGYAECWVTAMSVFVTLVGNALVLTFVQLSLPVLPWLGGERQYLIRCPRRWRRECRCNSPSRCSPGAAPDPRSDHLYPWQQEARGRISC